MTVLSVNLNKIAVLRNSRGGDEPDILRAARTCLDAGAHGITVHPRPDARHTREDDVHALAEVTREYGVEFNLEGNPFAPPRPGYPGFLALCEQARPAQATLVPDGDAQLTSDHGFDFARDADALAPLVARLRALGCRVSLFADTGADVARAAAIGAARVELYVPGRTGIDLTGIFVGPCTGHSQNMRQDTLCRECRRSPLGPRGNGRRLVAWAAAQAPRSGRP